MHTHICTHTYICRSIHICVVHVYTYFALSLIYALVTVFQLYLGGDVMYVMRRRKPNLPFY